MARAGAFSPCRSPSICVHLYRIGVNQELRSKESSHVRSETIAAGRVPHSLVAPTPSPPRLLDVLRLTARRQGHCERTISAFVTWVTLFVRFHGWRHPVVCVRKENGTQRTHLDSRGAARCRFLSRPFPAKAFAAVEILSTAAPGQVVPFLEQRLQPVPNKLDNGILTPERLQALRALKVLEEIRSPRAHKLLQQLASGFGDELLTQDAAASLQRLNKFWP